MLIKGNNICERISENRRYTHNSTFVIKRLQKLWVKNASCRKTFMQIFIASLVGELSLQWINPGHHRVRLFIGSTKIFVSSPYTKGTDVCLRCGDERIYRQSFFSEFAFLYEHRNMPGAKLYLGG